MSISRMISDFNSPTASPNRIPVSLRRAINHLRSSSISLQVFWISLITSTGIGLRVVSLNPSGMNVPRKPVFPSNPCSLIARLMIDRILENTRLTVLLNTLINQPIPELSSF